MSGVTDDLNANHFRPAESDEDLQELLISNKRQIQHKLSTVRRMTLSATVYHMLLALAKPSVWVKYSRDGKRGKKMLLILGLPISSLKL